MEEIYGRATRMNSIRIYVKPHENNKWYWALQEFDYPWWNFDEKFWITATNKENNKEFSGFTKTKEEGIEKAKKASKEYCFQRKKFEEKQEWIGSNTYIEEVSCQDLK
jgi:hypothetical protein